MNHPAACPEETSTRRAERRSSGARKRVAGPALTAFALLAVLSGLAGSAVAQSGDQRLVSVEFDVAGDPGDDGGDESGPLSARPTTNARYRVLAVASGGEERRYAPLGGTTTISLSAADVHAVTAQLDGLRVGAGADDHIDAVAGALTSGRVGHFARINPSDRRRVTIDVRYSRAIGADDLLLVQDRGGDSRIDLAPIGPDGSAIGPTVAVGPRYAWDTGHDGADGSALWASVIAVPEPAAGGSVSGLRIVTSSAELKVVVLAGTSEASLPTGGGAANGSAAASSSSSSSAGSSTAAASSTASSAATSSSMASSAAGSSTPSSSSAPSTPSSTAGSSAAGSSTSAAGSVDSSTSSTGASSSPAASSTTGSSAAATDAGTPTSVAGTTTPPVDLVPGLALPTDGAAAAAGLTTIGLDVAVIPAIAVGGAGCLPALQAGDATLPTGGGPVTFCFQVTNTGEVPVTDVLVTDTRIGLTDAALPLAAGSDVLAPGEQAVYYHHASVAPDAGETTVRVSARAVDGAQPAPAPGASTAGTPSTAAPTGTPSTAAPTGTPTTVAPTGTITPSSGVSPGASTGATTAVDGAGASTPAPPAAADVAEAPTLNPAARAAIGDPEASPSTATPPTALAMTGVPTDPWILVVLAMGLIFFGWTAVIAFRDDQQDRADHRAGDRGPDRRADREAGHELLDALGFD